MHCLVVTAHPLEDSLCTSLSRRIVAMLQEAGHSVVLEDLYAEGFEAAMTPPERASYYAGPYRTDAVAAAIDALRAAEGVVLVFPTWWFSFPAILKGWFDRVWAPGVAYDHAAGYGPIRPRLHDLRELLAVTSLGAPWWVDRLVMRQPVKRVLKTALVRACAPGCRFRMLSLYKSESLAPEQVARFQARIGRALAAWPLALAEGGRRTAMP
jgi:putative NADPH-quinone reductase